jgi:uncharacterized membrane-anchored protein
MATKQLQKRIAEITDELRHEVSFYAMHLIEELIELELELEAECNK